MKALLQPGMRLMRRLSVPAKLAFLAVILLLPAVVTGVTAEVGQADLTESIARERQGLAYARPLVRLSIQIGQLRDEVTAGGHPETISLSAVREVDQIDTDLAGVLDVHAEWQNTKALLGEGVAHTRTGSHDPSDNPTITLRLAAESVSRMITEVADDTGLVLDGHLSGHYLGLTLTSRLPSLVEAASQAQELETARRRGKASDLEAQLAAGLLVDRITRLNQTLSLSWETLDNREIQSRSASDVKALGAAVDVLTRSLSPRGGEPQLSSSYALSAAALDLTDTLSSGLDQLLAERIEDLRRGSLRRGLFIALTVLLALYVFTALYLAMTSDVRAVLTEISTLTSGGIHQSEALTGTDEFARMSGALVYARDQLTALVGALRYQATHDDLTVLGNRALIVEKLEEVLSEEHDSGPTETWVGLVIIDLDGFNDVNDSFGHRIGDHLLRTVGARFHKGVRRRDIVARLGGDDFAVLLPEISGEAEARTIVARLQETLQQPVVVGGRRLQLRVNAGIALCRPGEVGGPELMRNADVAKYAAKELGKGQVAVFEPAMHARSRDRAELSADLVGAVEQGETSLLFQPIVDMRSGRIRGAEALVRWQHPTRGDVPPDLFVPLAEATGLIQPIGRWVLRKAAEQLVEWHRTMPQSQSGLTLDVNLSAAQLTDDSLVEDILSIINETGVDPHSLVLEITESALMADIDTALRRLGQLSAIGVRLALDDFGTGYSSLSYLLRLPVSILKIDKSFVAGISGNDDSPTALLRNIVSLGTSLGMQTVAEGIEDETQETLLCEAGCHLGQGYRYSRPVTGEAFADLLRRSQIRVPAPRMPAALPAAAHQD
jgi:diguanylate cyclase (GGDEF)-like protein